jgi:hypothetical protein
MRKFANSVKIAAASLTGLVVAASGSNCLPDNYWANYVAASFANSVMDYVFSFVPVIPVDVPNV